MSKLSPDKVDTLEADVIAALKGYCYNNTSEFFRRHSEMLEMSMGTFLSLMKGNRGSLDKCNDIRFLTKRLNLLSPSDPSHYHAKQNIVNELKKLCINIIKEPSTENLWELQKFMAKRKWDLI